MTISAMRNCDLSCTDGVIGYLYDPTPYEESWWPINADYYGTQKKIASGWDALTDSDAVLFRFCPTCGKPVNLDSVLKKFSCKEHDWRISPNGLIKNCRRCLYQDPHFMPNGTDSDTDRLWRATGPNPEDPWIEVDQFGQPIKTTPPLVPDCDDG